MGGFNLNCRQPMAQPQNLFLIHRAASHLTRLRRLGSPRCQSVPGIGCSLTSFDFQPIVELRLFFRSLTDVRNKAIPVFEWPLFFVGSRMENELG